MSSGPATQVEMSDAEVRQVVVERVDRSFIVQAPAGSGKTELLSQRFLALLATVEEPEQVLAITFTRKAASEMRIRILEALDSAREALSEEALQAMEPHKRKRRELGQAVLRADERLGWRLLENPMRLQVRTVDSLADSIARQLPMLAGMAVDLQVTEEAGDLYREAAERTIAEIGNDGREAEAVATLLRYRDNKMMDVRDLLISMLKKRDQWLRIVSSGNTANEAELARLRAELEGALRRAVEEDLRIVRSGVKAALGTDAGELVRLSRIASEKLARVSDELPAASADELDSWRAIADLAMTKEGQIRKIINARHGLADAEDKNSCKAVLKALGERTEDADRVCALLTKVRKLPAARYSEDEWRFVRGLLVTLPRLAAHLKLVFGEEGQVDFIEMASAAKTALESEDGPTELGMAVGTQLKHLLVDEFQDTSQSQLGLVNALTRTWEEDGSNTLFLVGDPMQSIYAFREAEVSIFTRAFSSRATGGRDLRWKVSPARLRANFRSQRGLVEWFNRTHSQILTRDDDATSAVSYSEAEAIKEREPEAVTVKGFAAQDYVAEAKFVAEQVGVALAEDSAQTIAILVKARAHLVHIVRELEDRGIKFRAVKIDELAKRQTVLDLDALARAILDEADRTAWLAILRAPSCGLTLADLWELCRGDRDSTVRSLLTQRAGRLSPDGQRRVAKLLGVLKTATKESTTLSFRLVLERAWIELGGPATFKAEEFEADARDAAAYFDLLEERWAAGVRPGSRQFQSKLNELYAPADTDPSIRVELMTIHGAKGLEWDVVFIPALGRVPRGEDKQLLYWYEQPGEEELLLGPMRSVKVPDPEKTIECYLQTVAKERAKEEKKRLLYVATTRARRKLFLTGSLGKTGVPASNSLMALLWPVYEVAEQLQSSIPAAAAVAAVESTEVPVRPMRRLPEGFKLPEGPVPIEWKGRAVSEESDEKLHTYDWAGETRRRVGTVTHAFLQGISREGAEHWEGRRVEESRLAIRTALVTEGVGPEKIDEAIADVAKALTNSVSDERGRWILGARNEAASELAVTAVIDGEPRRLKIDRTFVEGNIRWIVDFKTTDIEGGDAERFFVDQVEKYREDLARYAEAVRKMDSREIRCALYFPLQKEFRVVNLESAG
jgi:ATP-dependent helicase/nuclease subunit A